LKPRKDLQLMKEILAGEFEKDGDEITEEGTLIPAEETEMVVDSTTVTEKKPDLKTILSTPIEDVAEDLEMSEPQFIKLKEKLMVDIVEHLTHLTRDELLTGNNKLSKKNVDLLEEYLKKNGLSFKE